MQTIVRDSQFWSFIPQHINDNSDCPNRIDDKYLNTNKPSFFASINLRKDFTIMGDYDQVIFLPKPILSYHKAIPNTIRKFNGKLIDLFPQLNSLSDEDIEKISKKRDLTE